MNGVLVDMFEPTDLQNVFERAMDKMSSQLLKLSVIYYNFLRIYKNSTHAC